MNRAEVSAFPAAQESAAWALAVQTSIAATSAKAPAACRREKSLGESLIYFQGTGEFGASQRDCGGHGRWYGGVRCAGIEPLSPRWSWQPSRQSASYGSPRRGRA